MAFEDWLEDPLVIVGIILYVCFSILDLGSGCAGFAWDPDSWAGVILAPGNMTLAMLSGPNCMVYAAMKHLSSLDTMIGIIVFLLIDRFIHLFSMVCAFKLGRDRWKKDVVHRLAVEDMECKNPYLHELIEEGIASQADGKDGVYFIEATNVYEDFSCPPLEYVIRFLGQGMLMWMLVYNIVYESPADEVEDSSEPFAMVAGKEREDFFFWSAVVVQLMAVTQVSSSFDERSSWWMYVLSAKLGNVVLGRCPPPTRALGIRLRRSTVLLRFLFSFIINGLCVDFIYMIIPLLLAKAETPIDYVKDTFAVAYIVTLDDLTSAQKYYIREPEKLRCWWGPFSHKPQQNPQRDDQRASDMATSGE